MLGNEEHFKEEAIENVDDLDKRGVHRVMACHLKKNKNYFMSSFH